MSTLKAFFNLLRKAAGIKVGRKTTSEEINKAINSHKSELARLSSQDKRLGGLFKLWQKSPRFNESFGRAREEGTFRNFTSKSGKESTQWVKGWKGEELEFLNERKGMAKSSVVSAFKERFEGTWRTESSIGWKFYRLSKKVATS